MSGYTAMAIAIGGMVMSAQAAKQQQDVANRNIASANAAARNNAIAEQQKAQYQAQVERNNAVIANQNAVSIGEAATQAAQRHSVRIRNTVGAGKARAGAMGFLVDDDSDSTIISLMGDLETAGQHDILTIYHNAELEERRARLQGDQFVAQAGLFEWKAEQGDTGVGYGTGGSSALAATAAFMSGAGSAYALKPA